MFIHIHSDVVFLLYSFFWWRDPRYVFQELTCMCFFYFNRMENESSTICDYWPGCGSGEPNACLCRAETEGMFGRQEMIWWHESTVALASSHKSLQDSATFWHLGTSRAGVGPVQVLAPRHNNWRVALISKIRFTTSLQENVNCIGSLTWKRVCKAMVVSTLNRIKFTFSQKQKIKVPATKILYNN